MFPMTLHLGFLPYTYNAISGYNAKGKSLWEAQTFFRRVKG